MSIGVCFWLLVAGFFVVVVIGALIFPDIGCAHCSSSKYRINDTTDEITCYDCGKKWTEYNPLK